MKKRITVLLLAVVISGLLVSCANIGSSTAPPQASSIFRVSDVEYCRLTTDATVRAGAGNSFPAITRLSRGTTLDVLGEIGDWYVVHLDNNRVGCVDSANARPVVKETEENEPTRPGRPPYQQVPPQERDQETEPPQDGEQEAEPQQPAQETRNLTSQERQMLDLINSERKKNELPALSMDSELVKLARMKAQDMVENNYFSHYSPNYGSPFDMMDAYGIEYLHAGENIAANSSVSRAHQSLMNSSGHRQNILSPNFTHIGIGIKPSEKYGYIFVQMFISKPQ